jgi:hypothetical protein
MASLTQPVIFADLGLAHTVNEANRHRAANIEIRFMVILQG